MGKKVSCILKYPNNDYFMILIKRHFENQKAAKPIIIKRITS